MHSYKRCFGRFSPFAAAIVFPLTTYAVPPTVPDVDVYSALCKIGSQTTVVVAGEIGAISRRILAGEAKLSASKLQDEFPGIRDEKNRLLALQSFQDCIYRYIDRFHPAVDSPQVRPNVNVSPNIPAERRREIVYLANELDSFKGKMARAIAAVPTSIYDKRDSTERKPKDDPRLMGLSDYSRYRAFEASSGGLDFSGATNNDLTILCNTYGDEIEAYKAFIRQYKQFALPPYAPTGEVRRICRAAEIGRLSR